MTNPQTNKETIARLTANFKDLGTTKKAFTICQKAYDSLYGEVRTKADLQANRNIGVFASACKGHLKSIKNNPNSGLFGEFVKTHFPLLTSNAISNCQWLNDNWESCQSFIKDGKLAVGNPEVLKRHIRKALDSKKNTTEEDYKKYGLKTPKPKTTKTEKEVKADEKTINRKSIDKLTNDELLAWTSALVNKLEAKKNNNALQFTSLQIKDVERISLQLADIQDACEVAVNTVTKKNNAEAKKAA